MAQKLKVVECDPICGFMVRSHNEKEVLDLAMQHVKKAHSEMNLSMADVKKQMKDA